MNVVVGLDESGNGAIAGPLVVAALAFPVTAAAPLVRLVRARSVAEVTPCDSKKVKDAAERATIATECLRVALASCTSQVDAAELDTMLVAGALRKAAGSALRGCVDQVFARHPDATVTIVVDGKLDLHFQPRPRCHVEYVAGADASRWQVGAASLVARSAVDRAMGEVHRRFPAYGFAQHCGYATPKHLETLRALGPCAEHRRTFKSVYEVAGIPQSLTELNP